jgi:eukaryotic-like serine/threonine-protein kinase
MAVDGRRAVSASLPTLEDDAVPPSSVSGRPIGPYRLLRELGHGGMGTVYLAERSDVGKRVALKVVRGEVAAGDDLQRFLFERRVLARLTHPNIAALLDAGVTDDGVPWFAMEYVDGEPITTYADRLRLTIEQRLRLFEQVCEAVAHAHQRLLVHRDVKPSNILVSAAGEVKLVDFGIAKLLSGDGGGDLTRTGGRVMTPEYAAPEQVRGDPITTATDIYGLGLVLYELLTGRHPFRSSEETPQGVKMVFRADAARPSSLVARRTWPGSRPVTNASNAEVAQARSADPLRLKRALAGDLDAITLKALRREPIERYPSVEAMQEDLRRQHAGLPVLARRGSQAYRARKFVLRHRGAIAAATLGAFAIAGYVVRERMLRAEAERLRDAARIEAARSEHVSTFLTELFAVANPFEAERDRLDTLRIRDFLIRRGARVADLKDQPEVQLQAFNVVARMYATLGMDDRARPMLGDALALGRRLYPSGHSDVVRSLNNLGTFHFAKLEYDQSEKYFREALAMGRQLYPGPHGHVAETLHGLSDVLRVKNEYAAAEPLNREEVVMRKQLAGEHSALYAAALNNLGLLLSDQGKNAEAEPILREALAIDEKQLPASHPQTASVLHNLGIVLQSTNRPAEAEPLMRRAFAIKREYFGESHPRVLNGISALVGVLYRLNRLEEAEALTRQQLAITQRVNGERFQATAWSHRDLANILRRRGNYAGAEREARAALNTLRAVLPAGHTEIGRAAVSLGRAVQLQKRHAEACGYLDEATKIFSAKLSATHERTIGAKAALGECLVDVARAANGEPLLRESVAWYRKQNKQADPDAQQAIAALVRRYTSTNRSAEAAEYRALLVSR